MQPYRNIATIGTLPRGKKQNDKTREKTFINEKRAQNCTILLTRLKMTNTEIRQTIMTMDAKNTLDKDMIEQVCGQTSFNNQFENYYPFLF